MIQPRNTLVLLRLKEKASRNVGAIVVPTNGELFTQAEVIAVGPGNVAAQGGISDTFDLKPGQRVLVIYKDDSQRGKKHAGIPVQQEGETLYLYEQARILGIIAQPGEVVESDYADEVAKPSAIIH